jgi:ketosteroid isomerase-like protein
VLRTLAKVVLGAATLCISVVHSQTDAATKSKEVPEFLHQLTATRNLIAEAYVHWTEAAKAKNVDAAVAMYTDDATVLPDEKDAVSGKDAIRSFYGGWFAQNDKLVEQKFENINSVQTGDMLIDSTSYSGILIRDGKEIAFKGKRLVVWKRDFQGPWKILRDTWNKSPML